MSKREKTHHELFASQVQSFAQLALKSMTGSAFGFVSALKNEEK